MEQPLVDIGKKEQCAKLQQKILKSMVVGARQGFWFFSDKIPGFSITIELFPNFCMGFCIT